jgi:hypothetical protein
MKTLILALGLFSSALAFADTTPDFYNVLSSATVDFANDGGMGRAVLVASPDNGTADLYLYTSIFNKDTTTWDTKLALVKKDAAFNGAMWAQQCTVTVNNKGALQLNSLNDGVGRDRWSQTLTIVYKNNDFYVVGITYSSRDTLDPKAGGNCDLNLVTGKGTRNGKPVAAGLSPVRLADWKDETLPKVCNF